MHHPHNEGLPTPLPSAGAFRFQLLDETVHPVSPERFLGLLESAFYLVDGEPILTPEDAELLLSLVDIEADPGALSEFAALLREAVDDGPTCADLPTARRAAP